MIPHIADHLLVFLLGVALPIYSVFKSQPAMKRMDYDTPQKIMLYRGNAMTLFTLAALVLLVWLFSGRDLTALGLGAPDFSGSWWVVLSVFFIISYCLDFIIQTSSPRRKLKLIRQLRKNTPFLPQTPLELKHFSLVAVSAGVCEEIIFRGYFIWYFLSFTLPETASGGDILTGQWLAIGIPAIIFALTHLYQGWLAVGKIVVMAVIFGWMYLEMQSLWWLIFLHTLLDFIGGFLAMKILSSNDGNPVEYSA